MNNENVGMIKPRDSACFLFEATQAVGVLRKISRQNFDRDLAVKSGVFRAIDYAHPTRAEWRDNFVRSKLCACGNRHFFTSAVQLMIRLMGDDTFWSTEVLTSKR